MHISSPEYATQLPLVAHTSYGASLQFSPNFETQCCHCLTGLDGE